MVFLILAAGNMSSLVNLPVHGDIGKTGELRIWLCNLLCSPTSLLLAWHAQGVLGDSCRCQFGDSRGLFDDLCVYRIGFADRFENRSTAYCELREFLFRYENSVSSFFLPLFHLY